MENSLYNSILSLMVGLPDSYKGKHLKRQAMLHMAQFPGSLEVEHNTQHNNQLFFLLNNQFLFNNFQTKIQIVKYIHNIKLT